MADSLALRVAKVEKELLKSRPALRNVTVNLKEEDEKTDATRIVVTATRGSPEMAGALDPTGIFNVSVKVEVFAKIGPGSAALVDTYLHEIDEANKTAPSNPSGGYASALSQLSVFIWKDDDDTAQEDGEEVRKAERTFMVMAKAA